MMQHYRQTDFQPARLTFGDFFLIFITVAVLVFLVIFRYSESDYMESKTKTEKAVLKIIALEKRYKRDFGKYGQISDIGFVNPFKDNRVVFSVNLEESEFIVKAIEAPTVDAFGDKIAGNEYYVGYSNGACEYNKR